MSSLTIEIVVKVCVFKTYRAKVKNTKIVLLEEKMSKIGCKNKFKILYNIHIRGWIADLNFPGLM